MDRKEYLTKIWKPYPAMPAEVAAAGRIHDIEWEDGKLRLVLQRDGKEQTVLFDKPPAQSEFLDFGDVVAVLSSDEIILLAPQLAPFPREVFPKDCMVVWDLYLNQIRGFFHSRHFIELQTPGLVVCPGTEPALDVFSTELKVGSRRQKLFLPTSPELHLKKALALGADKIFEIARCYRNGEITERHQPEFLMLEWYRAYDNLISIKKDVTDLITHLCAVLKVQPPRHVISYSVAELFDEYCGFHLTPQTTKEELRALGERIGVDVRSAESIDDYFFLIFMDKIESKLPAEDLIFVEKYPPYQAALARLTEDGWGDRFEAYWKGLELCNAFHELNDPKIQRLRSQEDLQKKTEAGKEPVSLDEEFFQSLEAGLPPSGGIALGVERLFMALMGIAKIAEIRLFPMR